MRSFARQVGDIAKEPELTAEAPRKSKGGSHEDENATLGHCLGLYSKEQSGSWLHITGSGLALSASSCPTCWDTGGSWKLVLWWPKETPCVCHGVRAVSRLLVGCSQRAATCHHMACCWCVAVLNTNSRL